MRAVKHRANCHGKRTMAIAALPAGHAAITARMATYRDGTAIWAVRSACPADFFEVFDRLFLGRERLENVDDIHGTSPTMNPIYLLLTLV